MNLRLLQISDSALPIGGYTHSWGLEAAIARRLAHDAVSLERFVRGWLRYSLAPLEGVIVACCCAAGRKGNWATIEAANALLNVSIAPPSIRAASREMGGQLLSLASTWVWSAGGIAAFEAGVDAGQDRALWHHAVVFGLLGTIAGAAAEETVAAYLHQAVVGMIGAGVRAIPVGHTHGQQMVAYFHDEIMNLAARCCERDLETAGGGSPFHEVLCDEQTHLYSRVFRS
jgi:urease accessory protein